MSRSHGVTDLDLQALAGGDDDAFAPLERLVLAYARHMTESRVEVPDELFAALREHLDDPQLVELTAVIAWENYRARFNHALGMESEGFSEGAYCPLPAPDAPRLSAG